MTEKIAFTMAKLASLKPFKSGRRTVYDDKVPGLTICITPAGGRSYYLYGRFGGKPRRHRIGGFPDLSVDEARRQARELTVKYGKGDDPTEERRGRRTAYTLGGLWERFLEIRGPKKQLRSVKEDQGLWTRHLADWEHRTATKITTDDVERWCAEIGRTAGPYAANRALSLLSTLYSSAKLANPCKGVDRFDEVKRDRFLLPEEFPRFWKALDAELNQYIAGAFRLMLLTGARKMNVLALRWQDVDLASKLWRIPTTKQGEPQQIPLLPEAVAELQRLKSHAGESPYVFPARVTTGTCGHLVDVTKAWRSVCQTAGLTDLRLHDLRRTMGSWQAIGGESLSVIGKTLGHRNSSTTEVYARLTLAPVREAMGKAVSAMMQTTRTVEQPADADGPVGVG